MTNVLMIYPEYPDTFWSFKHVLKFIGRKASFPPLGLLTIAPILPKEWNKKLVDMNVEQLNDSDLLWADYIFISAMIVQKESVDAIITRAKALGRTIVAGGPLFTTSKEKFPDIDHLILNEAEVTLPAFLEDLAAGKAKRIYTSPERPQIAKAPVPDWSLINMNKYASMCVQFSRGCPFNCEFCDIVIMNGRIPRTKAASHLLAELQSLYDAGWRGGVFIVDDNFIGNKQDVKLVLKSLIRWQKQHRYPFSFLTEASVDLASDDDLMDLMSAANFGSVFLGLETPDKNSLQECSKFQNTVTDLSESVEKIHKKGIQVMGGFIVGFDSDTEHIFDNQIKFIQQIGVVTAMVGILTALPQTRLWNRLKSEGRLLDDASGENTDGSLNFIPKMNREQLMAGYQKIMNTIYSPAKYYARVKAFIKTYTPKVKGRFSFREVHAFIASMIRIGIFSRSRKHYWKLLFYTLFTKAKAVPAAIQCAIYGLHFEKVAKQIAKKHASV